MIDNFVNSFLTWFTSPCSSHPCVDCCGLYLLHCGLWDDAGKNCRQENHEEKPCQVSTISGTLWSKIDFLKSIVYLFWSIQTFNLYQNLKRRPTSWCLKTTEVLLREIIPFSAAGFITLVIHYSHLMPSNHCHWVFV